MRHRKSDQTFDQIDWEPTGTGLNPDSRTEVAYDGARFFKSFYRSNARQAISDRSTIGIDFSLMEARFHYNATENAILKALCRRKPPAHGAMVPTAEKMIRQRRLRLLDLGAGTGHWIDFFRDAVLVSDVSAVEIVDQMADYLRQKYRGDEDIRILQRDICEPGFSVDDIGDPVDFISAIGIMFHIVDDDLWQGLICKLATMLKGDGLIFVGGDFGSETRNVQFHKTDDFETWREFFRAEGSGPEIKVNKRVRSLADWQRAAARAGLVIVDLVRTDCHPAISTPENDILVLAPDRPR